jgi:prepilin-type processing-associated H-X9-DG protein
MLALGDGYQRWSDTFPFAGGVVNLEAMFESSGLGRGGLLYSDRGTFSNVTREMVERRHRKRLNMAFCDGHAEDGKVQKWFFSEKDDDLRLWNADHEPR